MKKILLCLILFLVCSFSIAQTRFPGREEKLEQLKNRSDIKVTEIKKDILRLEYPNGKVIIKNIGNYQPPTNNNLQPTTYSPTYDSTIIDLTTIDTSLYYQKYRYLTEVPLHNWEFVYQNIILL